VLSLWCSSSFDRSTACGNVFAFGSRWPTNDASRSASFGARSTRVTKSARGACGAHTIVPVSRFSICSTSGNVVSFIASFSTVWPCSCRSSGFFTYTFASALGT
jgi:hypothetical protein